MSNLSPPLARTVTIRANEDGSTRIHFFADTLPGVVSVDVTAEGTSALVAALLNHAVMAAGQQSIQKAPEEVFAHPVMPTDIGIGTSKVAGEVLMLLRLGHLQLSFSIDPAKLVEFCKSLPSIPDGGAPSERH